MEERIRELKDKNLEMIQVEEEREIRYFKNEEVLWEPSDPFRKGNIRVTGIPEEREKGAEFI